MKYLNPFFGVEDAIITLRGNGEICVNAKLKLVLYRDTPFLTVTATFLNNIIPIAIGRPRLLLNRFKSNKSKSVNAEITVRHGQ